MSTITTTQEDLADLLEAHATLAGLSVLKEGVDDLKTGVEAAIGGKGIAIVVMEAGGGTIARAGTSVAVEVVHAVAILNNPPVNESATGAQKTSMEIVSAVLSAALAARWKAEDEAFRRVNFDGGTIAHMVLVSKECKFNVA